MSRLWGGLDRRWSHQGLFPFQLDCVIAAKLALLETEMVSDGMFSFLAVETARRSR